MHIITISQNFILGYLPTNLSVCDALATLWHRLLDNSKYYYDIIMIQLPECKVIDMTAFCQSLSIEMISLFKFAHFLLHFSKGSEHWYCWSHALILTFSKIKMHYYSMMVSNNLLPIQHNTMLFLSPFSTVVLLSYISVSLTHCCQASIISDRPENETNYTYFRHPIPTSQKLGGKKLFCC